MHAAEDGKDIARRAAELCGGALGKSRNSHAADDATPNYAAASLGNAAQMRWSSGEWIFRQMQMKISKVYWR